MSDEVAVRHPVLSPSRIKNLVAIRLGVEHHARVCCERPVAILLHPDDCAALDVDEVWGVPVTARDSVPAKRVQIQCLGDHDRVEQSLNDFLTDLTAN